MQTSFSDLEYASKKKQTRRDRFLAQLDAALAPFYPAGRSIPPVPLSAVVIDLAGLL